MYSKIGITDSILTWIGNLSIIYVISRCVGAVGPLTDLTSFRPARSEKSWDPSRMMRRLALLPALANIAVVLGLFGTVMSSSAAFGTMNNPGPESKSPILTAMLSLASITAAMRLRIRCRNSHGSGNP